MAESAFRSRPAHCRNCTRRPRQWEQFPHSTELDSSGYTTISAAGTDLVYRTRWRLAGSVPACGYLQYQQCVGPLQNVLLGHCTGYVCPHLKVREQILSLVAVWLSCSQSRVHHPPLMKLHQCNLYNISHSYDRKLTLPECQKSRKSVTHESTANHIYTCVKVPSSIHAPIPCMHR